MYHLYYKASNITIVSWVNYIRVFVIIIISVLNSVTNTAISLFLLLLSWLKEKNTCFDRMPCSIAHLQILISIPVLVDDISYLALGIRPSNANAIIGTPSPCSGDRAPGRFFSDNWNSRAARSSEMAVQNSFLHRLSAFGSCGASCNFQQQTQNSQPK